MIPNHLDEACETIDAALCTGNAFHRDADARKSLREYMTRWRYHLNVIDAADRADRDEKPDASHFAHPEDYSRAMTEWKARHP